MKAMKHCGARQGGFTLLEVLVAMTIVGLGVVTVIEVFSMGLRLGSRSADQTEAMTYGRQVMDDFLVTTKLEQGSEQGSLQDVGRWKVFVGKPVRRSVIVERMGTQRSNHGAAFA
ncbi:MAG: prepilin-type N-terminal cleavage/methylation domain-containing protein [Deltaproteobacteria bacterium]|nr:prepilin-type N-terminal cleavage/methylation domain-containing protein [Deltaproteobacteria bacterium]